MKSKVINIDCNIHVFKKQHLITSTVSIAFIKRRLLRQSIICDAITTIFDVGGASTGG